MNRILASMLLGCAAVLPTAASAMSQYYPTTVWSSYYQTLPVSDAIGTPDRLNLSNGRTGEVTVTLPFPVTFNDVTYTQVKVGAKGYVTFGTASLANNNAPANLVSSSAVEPKNAIAVWWADHFCDVAAGELRTQEAGYVDETDPLKEYKPHRFIIEWKCAKAATVNGSLNTNFRAQVIFHRLPDDVVGANNVIQAVYGDASVGTGDDWTAGISWGQRLTPGPGGIGQGGQMGPGPNGTAVCSPSGNPAPKCTGAHFPKNTVIQYGMHPTTDLSARVRVQGFSVDNNSVSLNLQTTFQNAGGAVAQNVTYDAYLTQFPDLFNPGSSSSFKVGSHGTPFNVAAFDTSYLVTDMLQSTSVPLNGRYYVCLDIDPAGVVPEIDKTNNRPCASVQDMVAVGPDLTGTIANPSPTGEAKATYQFPVTFSNKGTAASGAFEYVITAVPVPNPSDGSTIGREEDIYFGFFPNALAVNETTPTLMISVQLPFFLRDDKYQYRLIIDPYRRALPADADYGNNTFLSTGQMTMRKPKMRITPNPVNITFPFGCYYGQPLKAQYKLCNDGQMDAYGFRTGIAMGSGTNVSLLDDATAASFPQYCGAADANYNRQECRPVNGMMPTCSEYEYCVFECDPQSDTICPGMGLTCQYDYSWNELESLNPGWDGTLHHTCQLSIPKLSGTAVCKTIDVEGVIPRSDRHDQDPSQPGERYFHVMDDIDMMLSETEPAIISTTQPIMCNESLPDFVSPKLTSPDRVVAGEPFEIDRSIKNVGFIELPQGVFEEPEMVNVQYGYYLSRSRSDLSTKQIFVKVKSTDGFGVATVGSIANGKRNEDHHTELLEIPAEVEPGLYYIGIILDPLNQFRELDKSNNTLIFDTQIYVGPPSLKIVGDPPGRVVVNSQVTHQFTALGGVGTCRWAIENPPPSLVLNPDGLLFGRVTEIGSFSYTVSASCGDLTAKRTFIMEVVESRGTLVITTDELPPARSGVAYGPWRDADKVGHDGVQLTASGGLPPYDWAIIDGRAPFGINLSITGLLSGTPSIQAQTSTFTVMVTDKAKNTVTKKLTIVVRDGGSMALSLPNFPNADTGIAYDQCVKVSGGTPEYTWSDPADLPPGLQATSTGNTLCIAGVPTKKGNYRVVVTATDANGESLSRPLPLTVSATGLTINVPAIPIYQRGGEVDIRLSVGVFTTNPSKKVVFSLASGSLPEGVTLSKEGLISGTISKDAAFGAYNLTVRAEDEWGREGQKALALTVDIEAKKPKVEVTKTSGCSSSGTMDLSLLGLALVGVALLNRPSRRRAGEVD